MSSMIGGGVTTLCHLAVQYPLAAVCLSILGLGAHTVLTDEQKAQCSEKIAQCQKVDSPSPVAVAIATPVPSAALAAPVPIKNEVVPPVDPCADAPALTTADLFVSTGKPFLWQKPGTDVVSGKPPGPFLTQLKFTPSEQAVFLSKIEKQDGTVTTFKRGDVLGLMTTGSGKLRTNATVDYNPIAQTGTSYAKDNRMRVYSHKQVVRLNGDCVTRELILLEPFVCGNWTRRSDVITPVVR